MLAIKWWKSNIVTFEFPGISWILQYFAGVLPRGKISATASLLCVICHYNFCWWTRIYDAKCWCVWCVGTCVLTCCAQQLLVKISRCILGWYKNSCCNISCGAWKRSNNNNWLVVLEFLDFQKFHVLLLGGGDKNTDKWKYPPPRQVFIITILSLACFTWTLMLK